MTVRDFSRVRDQLWLLAHDDRDLHPHVDTRALDIGLAAAVLADLLLHRLITVRAGQVALVPGPVGPSSDDPIAASVLTAIGNFGTVRVADILRCARGRSRNNPYSGLYLRTRAVLVTCGVLEEHRRPLRSTHYELFDPTLIEGYRDGFVRRLVHHRDDADPALDCVCAVIWALNIHRMLFMPYSADEAEQILRDIVGRISTASGPRKAPAAIPGLAQSVRRAVGDLATAAF